MLRNVIIIIALVLFSVSCTKQENKQQLVSHTPMLVSTNSPLSPNETTSLQPNELGQVLVLEYHLIGEPEGEWRRTPENFQADLELLYQENYYPIKLQDYIAGYINVPKGKTPFILTFDDSSAGQFTARETPRGIVPTTDCAVGIMEDLKIKYPNFPLTATFFVLPGIKDTLKLFAQPDLIKEKLTYLVAHGYELGNHTLWHQNLAKANEKLVRKQLALANMYIQKYLPAYELKSLALPFGAKPNPYSLAQAGIYEGIQYKNSAILLVAGGPEDSVFSRSFNPYKIKRIQAADNPYGPKVIIKAWQKNPKKRFISDGDLNAITIHKQDADKINNKFLLKYRIRFIETGDKN